MELRSWLQNYTEQQTPSHEMVITNERQYQGLLEAYEFLQKAASHGYKLGPEFMAEDLRAARKSLAVITGQVSTEDVLDALFSRFCDLCGYQRHFLVFETINLSFDFVVPVSGHRDRFNHGKSPFKLQYTRER